MDAPNDISVEAAKRQKSLLCLGWEKENRGHFSGQNAGPSTLSHLEIRAREARCAQSKVCSGTLLFQEKSEFKMDSLPPCYLKYGPWTSSIDRISGPTGSAVLDQNP